MVTQENPLEMTGFWGCWTHHREQEKLSMRQQLPLEVGAALQTRAPHDWDWEETLRYFHLSFLMRFLQRMRLDLERFYWESSETN